jgi:hypothetical protein
MKLKARGFNEEKFEQVFGHAGPTVSFEVDQTKKVITLENGITASYTATIEPVEGFELLKLYKFHVECEAHNIVYDIEWTTLHPVVWLVHPLVTKLTSVRAPRGLAISGMSKEDQFKYASEVARYKAEMKAKKLGAAIIPKAPMTDESVKTKKSKK